MGNLFQEIKRRKIFQVAAVYAIITWLLVQIIVTIEEPLSLPEWTDTLVIVLLGIGFPVVLIFSWAFNVTAAGVVREAESLGSPVSSKSIEYVLIGLLVCAVGWLMYRDVNKAVPQSVVIETGIDADLAQDLVETDILSNSIAVLPFANLSPDPNNAYFAAGIHDTILHELAKISDMHVISRTTMVRYADSDIDIPQIAQELRVETVMEGSVQYADGRVLVTAQLIDPKTDAHLWSGNYDREFVDIFTIQADIAARIANALQAQLTPQETERIQQRMTTSTEAYALYLNFMERIEWDFSPGDATPENIQLLDRAIALDPEFAQAYAAKAWVYSFGAIPNVLLSNENAEHALQIDPSNAAAFAALAQIAVYEQREDDAYRLWQTAYSLSPNESDILDDYARFLTNRGDYDLALQIVNELLAVDPDRLDAASRLYLTLGDWDAALDVLLKISEIRPTRIAIRLQVALVEQLRRNYEAVRQHLNIAESLEVTEDVNPPQLATIAYYYSLLNSPENAQDFFERFTLAETQSPSMVDDVTSKVYAYLSVSDEVNALEQLRADIDGAEVSGRRPLTNHGIIYNMFNDPVLEKPEFLELRRRMGYVTPEIQGSPF
jgi:TolB-like protein